MNHPDTDADSLDAIDSIDVDRMATSAETEKFFQSTRGEIVLLLLDEPRTVKELAGELDLTDNAVRAHLVALERDGLVRQEGQRRSGGRPAYLYEVTSEADALFPKAYDVALTNLIGVLEDRLDEDEMEAILREAGRRAAAGAQADGEDLEARVQAALRLFGRLGGMPKAVRDGEQVRIWNRACFFSGIIGEHPEACLVAQGMLESILGDSVRTSCGVETSNGRPRCVYELSPSGNGTADG